MKKLSLHCISFVLFLTLFGSAFASTVTLAQADPEKKVAYTNPTWSPDGRSIAYVSFTYSEDPCAITTLPAGKSVHLATLSGGSWNHKVLANNADWPVWSRDGKRIAYNQGGLTFIDVASGNFRVLKKDEDGKIHYPIAWSPNGRYLLHAIMQDGNSTAKVFDLNTGRDLGITAGEEAFWMADGKLLSALAAPEMTWLRITDPTNGNFQALSQDQPLLRPFVAPNAGTALLWVTENAPHGEGIYRINLNTGVLGKEIGVRADQIYWDPTGKNFAFLAQFAMRAGDEPTSNLYVGNTNNWAFRIVGREAATPTKNKHDRMRYADWTRDGSSIAYVTDKGDIRILKL